MATTITNNNDKYILPAGISVSVAFGGALMATKIRVSRR